MSTGAGKGDSPRPVNGERYRANFDKAFRGNADRPKPCRECEQWAWLTGREREICPKCYESTNQQTNNDK